MAKKRVVKMIKIQIPMEKKLHGIASKTFLGAMFMIHFHRDVVFSRKRIGVFIGAPIRVPQKIIALRDMNVTRIGSKIKLPAIPITEIGSPQ